MSVGLYSGLDIGNFNGLYQGIDTGLYNGTVNNEGNPKLYLLDGNKNLVFSAYSIRKLSNSYTGPCIRVRRSSDNTEIDIGFNEYEQLDENTLLGFLNGSDGFVSVWYDQSGNSINVSQSTTTQQPRIATSGVIVRESGKPIINFDGVDDVLFNNSIGSRFTGTNLSKSFVCVHKFNVVTNGAIIASFGSSASSNQLISFGLNLPSINSTYSYANRSNSGGASYPFIASTITANTTSLRMFNVYQLDSFANMIINNVYTTSGDISTTLLTPNQFAIGGLFRTTLSNFANVNIHELIVYTSNQFENRSIIENNINQYYKLY